MSSNQNLRKTTSILIKPTNTEPGFDSRNTNLWVQACQVTAQQANTVLPPLSTVSLSLALFSCCRQLRAAETSNLLLGDRARPEQACGVVCAVRVGGGGVGTAGPSLSPSQALLGCTQSQPNKKPFIGRVQLSQTGWEHVAFKNEEGGIRGREAQNVGKGGWGEYSYQRVKMRIMIL